MIEFFTAPQNVPFTAALLLMGLIGLVEALGLGAGAIGLDLDADAELDGHDLLGWLGVGTLPLLVLLVLFLAFFGVVGLTGQQLAAGLIGTPLSPWIAGPAAGFAALPLTGLAARPLARILPRDETTAVELDTLVGRPAIIVVGRAAVGSPARARTEDRHGQAHFVMVEPNDPAESLGEGDAVLLVRRENHIFRAIGRGDALLPRLD